MSGLRKCEGGGEWTRGDLRRGVWVGREQGEVGNKVWKDREGGYG